MVTHLVTRELGVGDGVDVEVGEVLGNGGLNGLADGNGGSGGAGPLALDETLGLEVANDLVELGV